MGFAGAVFLVLAKNEGDGICGTRWREGGGAGRGTRAWG